VLRFVEEELASFHRAVIRNHVALIEGIKILFSVIRFANQREAYAWDRDSSNRSSL